MKLLEALKEFLFEEPNVERISQKEDPVLALKRINAEIYLANQSPKWRGRRIINAPSDSDPAHEGPAQ